MEGYAYHLFRKLARPFVGRGIGRYSVIAKAYRLAYRKFVPQGIVLVKVQGVEMYVDAKDVGISPDLIIKGGYEKAETDVMKSVLKPGMTVFDAGSNVGYFTLIASRLVGPRGKVYAFEPEPHNFGLLKRNIRKNGCSNVVAVGKALSSKSGTVRLYLDVKNHALPSLSEGNVSQGEGHVDIQTTTLDDFIAEHRIGKVDFIKNDTQGAEGLVLDGGAKTIRNNDLKIIMEFWPHGLRNMGTDPVKLLKRLHSFGFSFSLIKEEVPHCTADIGIAGIMGIIRKTRNGRGGVNLLLGKR